MLLKQRDHESKGQIFNFLDSDDKIIENSLEKVKKEIEKNKFPDLILGLYKKENFPFSNKIYFNKIRKRSFIKKRNFLKNLYQRQLTLDECWPFIVKRDFLRKKGIQFPDLNINEDQIFSNNLILASNGVLLLKEFFYFHKNTEKSLSKDFGINRCLNYFTSIF